MSKETTKQNNNNNNQDEIVRSASLSQGEVQQLLHELRDTLSMVTEIKNEYKNESSRLWELSDKDEYQGQDYFWEFSLNRKIYLVYKRREKRLVNLITQIKGLQ